MKIKFKPTIHYHNWKVGDIIEVKDKQCCHYDYGKITQLMYGGRQVTHKSSKSNGSVMALASRYKLKGQCNENEKEVCNQKEVGSKRTKLFRIVKPSKRQDTQLIGSCC